jgi:hypothetical protein
MKFLSNRFTYVLIISIILISSCSSPSNSLNTIPKKVGFIANLNLSNLKDKSGGNKLTDLYSFKSFKKEIRKRHKDLYRIIDEVLTSSTNTGIDFNKDLFIFYLNEVKDEHYLSFVFDLDNSEKFGDFIDSEILNLQEDLEIQDGKNFKYILFNKEFGIGWDNDKAIILIPENLKSKDYIDFEMDNLFNLKEPNRITNNPSFSRFYEEKKDLNIWLNTNLLLNNERFDPIRDNLFFDLEDQSLFTYISFDNGEMKIANKLDGNGEMIQMLNELSFWNKNENKIPTQLIPKDAYANGKISINPEAVDDLLFEFFDDYKKFKNDFEREMKISFSDAINSIDGNISFSLDDFEMRKIDYQTMEMVYNDKKYRKYNNYTDQYYYEGGYDYIEKSGTRDEFTPLIGLTIGLKNKTVAIKFIKELPERLIENHKEYISFNIDNGKKIYTSINDKFIYLTNDEDKIRNLTMNNFEIPEKDLHNNREKISNSDVYFLGKLNFENYPKELKKQFRDMQNQKEVKMFKTWNDFAKNIEIIKNHPNQMEIIFKTNTPNKNSLESLIELLDVNYKILNQ